jgi:hypothetical protein
VLPYLGAIRSSASSRPRLALDEANFEPMQSSLLSSSRTASVLRSRQSYCSLLELWRTMEAGGTFSSPNLLQALTDELSCNRPNITIFFTLLAVGVAFGWLGVEDPSKWNTGIVLYVLGRSSSFHARSIHSTHGTAQ